jgi:hypothetical protein
MHDRVLAPVTHVHRYQNFDDVCAEAVEAVERRRGAVGRKALGPTVETCREHVLVP